MDSFLVIKVKYRDTLRRFNARIDDAERLDLNMDGLRAKIIALFNFPLDAELTLTYIDEDGDVVTLVDDDDLCDVMRQRLKFLRIDVQLNNDKLNKPYAGSSGSSTPLRSPSVQPPSPSFNAGAADVLKTVPEPLRDVLSQVVSNFSFDVASKAASASPVLGDLVECLSKMGQSYLSPVSESGAAADPSVPVGSSESPSAPTGPDGLRAVLPKFTAVGSSRKASNEANTGNATRGVGVPAISEPVAVDMNVDPPSDANLTGFTSISSGLSASNVSASYDKKNTKENKVHIKGKSVSFDTSTPSTDASRKYYPINEMGGNPSNDCPFSGVPLPPFPYHPFSPSKSSFVSNDGNVMYGTFHKGIQCDGCGVLPITGPRFKSKVKDDYDLCSICFSKMGNEADYIRMDRPVHYRHPWCIRTSNDHIPRVGGPVPPHVLRNRVKIARPKLDSRFILDVNVPDGTVIAPSVPFTKIWRMRNNGNLPWSRGMQLVWIGGDKLGKAISVDIEIPANGISVDGELDIAVDFTAPQLPGRYESHWRMASQSGIKFGQRVWLIIHVDASLADTISDNLQGLNLNLPPESSGPRESGIIDMNVDNVTEVFNSNTGTQPVKPVVNENSTKEQTVDNSDVPTPVASSPSVTYPIVDQGVVMPGFPPAVFASVVNENSTKEQTVDNSDVPTPVASSPSVTYPIVDQGVAIPGFPPAVFASSPFPTIDQGVSAPAFPQTRPSSASYPIFDLSEEEAIAGPSQEGKDNALVEQTLLKELEDMGFKQVDLNKEILRMNEYDLEKSVDDLCGVAEWDPILEELQEMGFCDEETNKKLLKKNNGSIKGVVMDLLAGERA